MAHNNTVFSQLLKYVPRHEFEHLANQHHEGRRFRKTSRWSQFVAMSLGQLAGRQSLRDIESNMKAQNCRLYHLGTEAIPRSTLARLNSNQPYTLYEALFAKLYDRCRAHAPGHPFKFKNKLYSLDASLIDLSLKIFPWAHYALGKAAMKLHIGLDHSGYLPSFAAVTVGKVSDIEIGRMLNFTKRSIVVFDKGYVDYRWFKQLNDKDIFFVTRIRKNMIWRVDERRQVDRSTGVTSDQTIALTGIKPRKLGLPCLRRVGYRDPNTGKHYQFLTNNFELDAKTVAEIYKERWQVELFFKWIKQNLKIKAFVGNSKNAVMTQIWIAICTCLLLAYLKFSSSLDISIQKILRLLQLNLFMRRDLMALLRGDPPDEIKGENLQLRLI